MISDGEKFACESCIRGHRVTGCQHTDRPLQRVSKKGRPVSQCTHCRSLRTSRSVHTNCKCGSTSRQATLKQFGRDRCLCSEGGPCICPYKKTPRAADETPSTTSRSRLSTPSPILGSQDRATEIAQHPRPPNAAESVGATHHIVERDSTHFALRGNSLDDRPSDTLLGACTTLSDVGFPDFATFDTQDWMTNCDAATGTRTNEQAHTATPTFAAPLSSTDPSILAVLSNELSRGEQFDTDANELPSLSHWDLLDLMTTDHDDPDQWLNQPWLC